MGKYDFDKRIERRGTACFKYDAGPKMMGRDDLLPLWVADMDFALPEEILAALRQRVDHGVFGYTYTDDRYLDAVEHWFKRRYSWEIDRECVVAVPGVVYAVTCAIRALTEPGDAVLIQEPVYYPFRTSIEKNGRICVNNQLRYVRDSSSYGDDRSWPDDCLPPVFEGAHYEIDFADFERRIIDHNVRAFILCSPHNPVGRVWTEAELQRMGDICLAHGVAVISDEIHCDFVYGHDFISYGRLGERFKDQTIICTAPSKTFNLAGLQASNILIPDRGLRERFRAESSRNGFGEIGTMAKAGVEAAYTYGAGWLDELLIYLQGNLNAMEVFINEHIPQVKMIRPEGTYLVWLDLSEIAGSPEQIKHLIVDKARLWLDNGSMFSSETWMFERVNIATTRARLMQALSQLEEALIRTQ